MERRSFVEAAALLPFGAAAQTGSTARSRRVFVLEQYHLKNGTQPARIHEYLEKALLPAMKRAEARPAIFLEALITPHMPQVASVSVYDSIEHMYSTRMKLASDSELLKAMQSWESAAEQPYEHLSSTLLQATPYCPELMPDREPRKTQRVFELRVYHSPTWRQLAALHERFAGPEIKIFARSGIHPVLYSSGVFGQNLPNLTYLIPFDNLDAREKGWAAFGADPEWIKVRKESIDRSGQISSVMQMSLYRATRIHPSDSAASATRRQFSSTCSVCLGNMPTTTASVGFACRISAASLPAGVPRTGSAAPRRKP